MERKGKILIVDDNPKNIQLLGNILHDHNYEVEIALGGHEAIDWLTEEYFDLLLLDIMMPEINGFEVCKKIRSISKYDTMPIIFLSAKSDKESTVYGFEIGGQDFISKPFDTLELLARVNTHIELKTSKEKLIKINDQLEEKVNIRTLELQKTNEQLQSLTESKDKFLSFIGKEITLPLNSLNKAVNSIKHSAESSKLSEMINLLEQSVDKIDLIAQMANQITLIKNGSQVQNKPINLNNTIEQILIHLDETLNEKQININCQLMATSKIHGDKGLIKNSIVGVLDTILKYMSNNNIINIDSNSTNTQSNLTISCKKEAYENTLITHKESLLYFSYSDLIMNFHHGEFTIEEDDNQLKFEWIFNNK